MKRFYSPSQGLGEVQRMPNVQFSTFGRNVGLFPQNRFPDNRFLYPPIVQQPIYYQQYYTIPNTFPVDVPVCGTCPGGSKLALNRIFSDSIGSYYVNICCERYGGNTATDCKLCKTYVVR